VHEDPAARAIWDQLVPRLARIGLARSIDGLSLGRYCVILAQWAAGVRFLRENGRTHVLRAEGKGGKPGPIIASKQRPEVPDTARLAQQLIALEREFGLTPAARTRIRTEMDQQAKGDANELKRRFFAGPNAAPA
jgi:P27 family predicted phage terminase small subunit